MVVGVVFALLALAFVTYAALAHRSHSTYVPASGTGNVSTEPMAVPSEPVAAELPKLRPTGDPEAFAREVAEALFAWDTTTPIGRSDHIEKLITVGDPTGESTAGLLFDLDGYLPTDTGWRDLALYETKQWLSIASVTTPTKWAEAEAQSSDELTPGTTAFTIHGTRHRSGVWEGAPVSSEHDVAFTVFIVCRPSYPDCRLLRLSVLDKPLD